MLLVPSPSGGARSLNKCGLPHAENKYEKDVIKQLKSLISYSDARLTVEVRNPLSIAYKHITGTLRTSWRTVEGIEEQEAASANRSSSSSQKRSRTCWTYSTGTSSPPPRRERSVFFHHKMYVPSQPILTKADLLGFLFHRQGECHRYLAKFAHRQQRERKAQLALEAYKASYRHAFGTLPPWHPTRLGVALNFSVLIHDVHGSPDRCHLAMHEFNEAVAAMHATPEATFRDSLMIIHLLRDDIILWSVEI